MMPTVSVIIPTYNRAHMLREAIQSVLDQTYQDWELIVVDDGSTDGTPEAVKPYLADSRIHFLKRENSGLGSARNFGIRIAKGKYLAFLDDDDLFLPHKLEKQVAWLEAHQEVGLLYSYIQIVDGNDGKMSNPRTSPLKPGRSFIELFQKNFIQVATVLIRRECFERLGYFDELIDGSEDYFMWLRIAERFPIDYLPETLAIYRKHGQNKSLNLIQQRQSRLKIIHYFQVDLAKGLTCRIKNRCLSIIHYQLAREYRKTSQYFKAAGHFFNAFRFDPAVGIAMKRPPIKGVQCFIQFLKPYGGVLYCATKGFLNPLRKE